MTQAKLLTLCLVYFLWPTMHNNVTMTKYLQYNFMVFWLKRRSGPRQSETTLVEVTPYNCCYILYMHVWYLTTFANSQLLKALLYLPQQLCLCIFEAKFESSNSAVQRQVELKLGIDLFSL